MIKGHKAGVSYDVISVDSDEVGLYFLQEKKLYLYEEKCGVKPKVLREVTAMIRQRYGPKAIVNMETLECIDDIMEVIDCGGRMKIQVKGNN
jgi:hypothetical protein